MLGPPGVVRGRRPVGGALDVAVEGLPELAGPVAAPPVSPVLVHLVVERMVHLRRERPARSAARGEPAAALRAARSAAQGEPAAALRTARSAARGQTGSRPVRRPFPVSEILCWKDDYV